MNNINYANAHGIPPALFRALTHDDYDPGPDSDFSVSQLMDSPRIRLLKKDAPEVTWDAAWNLWLLLGKAVHAVLEHAAEGGAEITERRLVRPITVDNKTYHISGQMDSVGRDLWDWKITSAWTLVRGDLKDWPQRMNIYRWILKGHGIDVDTMNIGMIFRDWSAYEAGFLGLFDKDGSFNKNGVYLANKLGDRYPKVPFHFQQIEPIDNIEDIIAERIRLHVAAEAKFVLDRELPLCSSRDRWEDPPVWKVMKEGRKRALRNFNNQEDAEAFALENGGFVKKTEGGSKRCKAYCMFSQVCDQWKEENARAREG